MMEFVSWDDEIPMLNDKCSKPSTGQTVDEDILHHLGWWKLVKTLEMVGENADQLLQDFATIHRTSIIYIHAYPEIRILIYSNIDISKWTPADLAVKNLQKYGCQLLE